MRYFVLAAAMVGAGFAASWLIFGMNREGVPLGQDIGTYEPSLAGSHAGPGPNASSERLVAQGLQQASFSEVADPNASARSSAASVASSISNQVAERESVERLADDINGKAASRWESPTSQPERMLEAASITCRFGAGLTGGVRSLPNTPFEYQGSPIGFDTFDIASGTARITGNIAGSTYEAKVRVDATPGGLHFSGTLPSGNFVLITIFGLVANDLGDYAAILSMHNQKPTGLHTQINSGSCH